MPRRQQPPRQTLASPQAGATAARRGRRRPLRPTVVQAANGGPRRHPRRLASPASTRRSRPGRPRSSLLPYVAPNHGPPAVREEASPKVKALNEINSSLGWRVVYSWVGDDPCGHGDLPPWSGVTCSQQGDYRVVTELEVYAVSIVGPFPTAVTNLLDLRKLDLHNNKLTGPIPPQIGRLRHLKILNLRWNKLQDVLPPEIGELKKLTHLYLSFNNFKGEIPVELANLPELRYLYLHENRFTGRIPPELGTLKNLRHLDVGSNHLIGTLRDFIGIGNGFPSLRNLYVNNNQLIGVLPDQIANLTNLEILHLSNNRLIGSISPKLVNIPRLTYLYLDNNNFIGRIPEGLYKHPFLKELYVEGNQFRPGTRSKGTHKVLELPEADALV